MSFGETVVLGALAGFTIYLGLPLARLRLLGDRSRVALAMFAVGVLAFLFVDVMGHGLQILEDAVTGLSKGRESFGHAALLALFWGSSLLQPSRARHGARVLLGLGLAMLGLMLALPIALLLTATFTAFNAGCSAEEHERMAQKPVRFF